MSRLAGVVRWALVGLLVVDAILLATLELFFLLLRLPSAYGGWMLPVTIVLAALTTPLLVSTAGRLVPGRVAVAGAPLAAWLLTIIVLGVAGPGGDTVLPVNLRSLALLAAGVVPSGIVLGRIGAAALTELTAPERAAAPPPAAAEAAPTEPGVRGGADPEPPAHAPAPPGEPASAASASTPSAASAAAPSPAPRPERNASA